MLSRQERRELHQPGWCVRGERIDDRGAARATTELTDGLEHRIERLLAPESLDALPVREAHRRMRSVDLSLELLRERRLADARLTRDEGDLRLPGARSSHALPQLGERTRPADEAAFRHRCWRGIQDVRRKPPHEPVAPSGH